MLRFNGSSSSSNPIVRRHWIAVFHSSSVQYFPHFCLSTCLSRREVPFHFGTTPLVTVSDHVLLCGPEDRLGGGKVVLLRSFAAGSACVHCPLSRPWLKCLASIRAA